MNVVKQPTLLRIIELPKPCHDMVSVGYEVRFGESLPVPFCWITDDPAWCWPVFN